MKSGLTYLIFVIDRSGSMASIRDDMIGGFNTFIKSQKDAKLGDCRVFAYKFDNIYETMFEDVDLNDVPALDRQNYVPRDMTALYDAVATTIDNMGARLANMKEEDRPEKVLVVTITDGEENSSRKFNQQNVADRIKTQREQYNWDFAYIGANQDAWAVGTSMNVAAAATMNYVADSAGTARAFSKLCASTSDYRSTKGAKFAFALDPDDDKKPATPKSSKGGKKSVA